MLTARKLLQAKQHDMQMAVRGILRGFGLKVGPTTPPTFEARVRALVVDQPTLVTMRPRLCWRRGRSSCDSSRHWTGGS